MSQVTIKDYSLVGPRAQEAIDNGLAEADWYQSPVPREEMRSLLERRDWPAIRDTFIWFALLAVSGIAGFMLWGTWWAIIPFAIYGVLYGSVSDSRWHETSHGTAFKTDWLNNLVYEIASFMVFRESTPWRWSHTRHHTDTIIVGRDPEISVPRPPNMFKFFTNFIGVRSAYRTLRTMLVHVTGRMTPDEKTFVPEDQWTTVYWKARLYVLIHLSAIGSAVYFQTWLPVLYIGGPVIYGSWLLRMYGYMQHGGLAEDVLDHRLNSRTIYMNFIHRYLYWNMNYHVEHHMYPLVPYHQLPRLHALVKDDMPTPYPGIINAYREIIPAVIKQVNDPGYYVRRKLPERSHAEQTRGNVQAFTSSGSVAIDGWIDVCPVEALPKSEVVRFDHGPHTFAIYRTDEDQFYATDGICTHGRTHLAEGWVSGNLIECPKHNGRFDVRDGSPRRPPVCVGLRTYDVKIADDKVQLNVESAGGAGVAVAEQTHTFEVKASRNVATFIREVELQPQSDDFTWTPGDYMQFNIPVYHDLKFETIEVAEPFRELWSAHHVFSHVANNEEQTRRNYSIASNPATDKTLRFNIRIATPPRGQDCPPGVGSSHMWNLKPGDTVTAIGPFGDFHIKPTDREMIYIGGGAGMAPLRSHLSSLLETDKTNRKINYWYGARSRQEIFYEEYFRKLEEQYSNFKFHIALSQPMPEDDWDSYVGFIHEVVRDEQLKSHKDLSAVEFYLCGPPVMIQATTGMLSSLGVTDEQIAFDEFT